MMTPEVDQKKKYQLDNIFTDHIGELGCYQIWMFFLLGIMSFCGTELIYTNFTALEIPHVCKVPELANLTFEQQQYIVAPVQHDGAHSYSQCDMFLFNYSTYSLSDFRNWNRSEELKKNHPRNVTCSSYVFKDKFFKHSIVEEVGEFGFH